MKKRKIKMRFILICFMLLTIIIFVGIFNEQQKLMNKKTIELDKLKAKIDKEKKLNKELKSANKERDSEAFIERVARDKLRMVRPNEILYIDINSNN